MAMLSKKEVIARTGLSAVTIWRRIRAGDFPAPCQLSPNRVGWPDEKIDKWEQSRPVGMSELPENLKDGPVASINNRREQKQAKSQNKKEDALCE